VVDTTKEGMATWMLHGLHDILHEGRIFRGFRDPKSVEIWFILDTLDFLQT